MENILDDLIAHLESIRNSSQIKNGDLSDLGNEIGIAIGRHTGEKNGFEKDAFVVGIYHGISISDGTHGF